MIFLKKHIIFEILWVHSRVGVIRKVYHKHKLQDFYKYTIRTYMPQIKILYSGEKHVTEANKFTWNGFITGNDFVTYANRFRVIVCYAWNLYQAPILCEENDAQGLLGQLLNPNYIRRKTSLIRDTMQNDGLRV